MCIKEKLLVELDTQTAKCEKPNDKNKQLSLQFDSTKKYWISLKFRIVDTTLKKNLSQ
jgi:hypothetical protein